MTSYDTANSVRQRATLDMIAQRISSIIEYEADIARFAENLADEVCGAEPDAAGTSQPSPPSTGRLETISSMLDVIELQQRRVGYAGRRLARSLSADAAKEAVSSLTSGQIIGSKGLY